MAREDARAQLCDRLSLFLSPPVGDAGEAAKMDFVRGRREEKRYIFLMGPGGRAHGGWEVIAGRIREEEEVG